MWGEAEIFIFLTPIFSRLIGDIFLHLHTKISDELSEKRMENYDVEVQQRNAEQFGIN
jgi:hypothetical protein